MYPHKLQMHLCQQSKWNLTHYGHSYPLDKSYRFYGELSVVVLYTCQHVLCKKFTLSHNVKINYNTWELSLESCLAKGSICTVTG